MPFLKIKNQSTGEWEDIPMIKGDPATGDITDDNMEQIFSDADKRYLPVDTVSGSTIQTKYAIETNAKNYRIYGNSVQDGTTTNSVGDLVTSGEHQGEYKIETKVCGKNLIPFSYSDPIRTRNGVTYTVNSDGTIVANGTATDGRSYFVIQDYIKLPVGTYRMCGCPSGGSTTTYSIYCDIYESSTWKSEPCDTGNGTTINVVNNQYKLKSFTINIANGTTVNNLVFKPQLELGSTATEYEPYRESTITTYLDEPLRKIGDYADYIDFVKQKIIRNVGTDYQPLTTPTEENITLSAMPLKEDVNNISCTTTTQTSNIEVTYYQNPTKVINSVKNLISGSQYDSSNETLIIGVVNNTTYNTTTETLNL